MKKTALAILTVCLLLLAGCDGSGGGPNYAIDYAEPPLTPAPTAPDIPITAETEAKYAAITAARAQELTCDKDSGAIVVDVRTTAEFMPGHIPGARTVPNVTIGDALPESLPDVSATLIVCGSSAAQSREAALKLIQLGYANVYDLGDISDWPGELAEG